MKTLVCAVLLFAVGISASPKKYSYVSTAQFEDRISDAAMHSHIPYEQPFAKYKDAKQLADEITSDYWLNAAKAFVEAQVERMPNKNQAKNVIMFLGDGMSHPTIAAARVYMGGEEKKLAFENFPYTASSKTYCVDKQVADSACTATAYLTGVKANDATIGLSARALRSNCAAGNDASMKTESIASWAMKVGKDAGFVTTTRVTHASPTGVYGNIADRDWENDVEITKSGCDPNLLDDIAEQLVHGTVGKQLKVAMGGGSKHFIDQRYTEHGTAGARNDGKHLINEWRAADTERTYVNNRQGLMALDPENVKQVLGLFNNDHVSYNLDIQRDGTQASMPSLTDMTEKAIDILSQNEKGYFLFVEGGRIDHGHHKNEAKYAVDEAAEFSKAIDAALKKVNLNETLIVVTADHGHVMTMSGYAARGNEIFGMAGNGQDGMPYMTLSYANGLGYYGHTKTEGGRVNPAALDRSANNFRFPATVPVDSETHGGEDVGIWAVGPWAHLFQGTLEQHVIPHVMAYASCVGDGLTLCKEQASRSTEF